MAEVDTADPPSIVVMKFDDLTAAQITYFDANYLTTAQKDVKDWTSLATTSISTTETRAMYFYHKNPPGTYRVEFPNPDIYKMSMLIDPCKG